MILHTPALFKYRIVETTLPTVPGLPFFMPQRGVEEELSLSGRVWRDALPAAVSTFGLAEQCLKSIEIFDRNESEGIEVVRAWRAEE